MYRITNLVNGHYYIGKHSTRNLNDGYMGSGRLIKAAIQKYGRDMFRKDILFIYDDEATMYAKEAELVTKREVNDRNCYNMHEGGTGGWAHINDGSPEHLARAKRAGIIGMQNGLKQWFAAGNRTSTTLNPPASFTTKGMKFSEERKAKQSARLKANNPMAIRCWIENGSNRKAVLKSDAQSYLNDGWVLCSARKIRDKVWINNGTISRMAKRSILEEKLAQGWSKGRLKKVS